MVNKIRDFIRKNSVLISFLLVFLGFMYLKIANLQNYYFYNGRVIELNRITSKHRVAGKSGRGIFYISKKIPKIEYYVNKDTVQCDQGELKLVTNFKINEKITVLVEKENLYHTKIFSLFYYWIEYNELILVLLSFLFILGFIKNFV
ncbi:hypothetical protein GKZ90_0009935 [Flavobacterium sp. MC2016-06]|uniref:hypothetical protein n=1 Tax=Flavobacterium sp. MC2016-06 TaxID=2676308 RepID=UPI0012BA587B|nr:hypothetical protein [Flavobacterium sp. MC2016-06]MBU3859763.1 hypothetical protein [Flavobacterium sp. MC2016-06]